MMKKYDKIMMNTAKLFAEESYARRLKVGAVLAKDGRILITGYNGTISGMDNTCEEVLLECDACGYEYPYSAVEIKDSSAITKSVVASFICNSCGKLHKDEYESVMLHDEDIINRIQSPVNLITFFPKLPHRLITKDFVLHAEQNVISYAAKKGISVEGATLYVTHSPCKECAKLIAQSGITRVVYGEEYRDLEGVSFLRSVNVEVERYL